LFSRADGPHNSPVRASDRRPSSPNRCYTWISPAPFRRAQ
jgi:hypothetical protein